MKNAEKMLKEVTKIKSLFPKLIVTKIIDYADDVYIVEAVQSINKSDFSDPYYAVEKKNYKIRNFSPAYDLPAFFDALENRTIWYSQEVYDK